MRTCPKCKTKFPMNVTFCLNDGTPLLEPGELTEGMVVAGKYRIIAKTGQADMSTLYKALHLRLDEVRALKVMNAELARDPLFLKRFEQEALLTRKLQHPNVLRVDDIEETEDGRPFMVMEYIEGKTLKNVIKEEAPLAAWRAGAIGRQVASALDAAHQLGMIHRDIKPDNIELVPQGGTPSGEQAKVLEFGVAKMKEARREENAGMLTLSGAMAIIGTPQYMSPELCMGKRGDELDGRSDLYTLGIVMYEMLTGALPFKSGTMMNMIMAHVQTPPAPIQSARPDVTIPEPLANLVMKCLEKDRNARPASAKAMVGELDQILEGLSAPPGVKKPAPPSEPPARAAAQPVAVAPPPPAHEPPPPAPAVPAPLPRAEAGVEPPAAPKLAAPSAEVPAPRFAEHVTVPPPKRSGAMIGIGIVAFVVLGLGVWYVFRARNSNQLTPAPSATQVPAPKTQPVSASKSETPAAVRTAPQETSQPATEPARENAGEPGATSSSAGAAEAERPAPAKKREQVGAAIRQGDLYYQNGQYDNAIREYEKGLSVDPSSAQLRQKMDRAKRAKATEEALQ